MTSETGLGPRNARKLAVSTCSGLQESWTEPRKNIQNTQKQKKAKAYVVYCLYMTPLRR